MEDDPAKFVQELREAVYSRHAWQMSHWGGTNLFIVLNAAAVRLLGAYCEGHGGVLASFDIAAVCDAAVYGREMEIGYLGPSKIYFCGAESRPLDAATLLKKRTVPIAAVVEEWIEIGDTAAGMTGYFELPYDPEFGPPNPG